MMKDREFNALVRLAYEQAVEDGAGGIVNRSWLTQQIMSQHSPPQGPDADFYLCGTHRAVRAEVEKHIRTRVDDNEPTLPGFDWVQQRYAIMRDDELCDVPTPLMSVTEIRVKAKELRRMGLGMLRHADELERYADMREAEQSQSQEA